MMKSITELYHKIPALKKLVRGGINLSHYFWTHFVPDRYYIQRRFKTKMGYYFDIDNPITLNEKINWLKLHSRTPLHTQCSDKYAVRDYVREKVGEEYLVPLFLMTKDVGEINAENLPNKPFIVKTNHDSGGGVVIKDKSKVDWIDLQKKLSKRLKQNYYYKSKEWQYKNIDRCIIVEKLLSGHEGDLPFDYKLHCFNGQVTMIQVDTGRYTQSHHRNWYNINWEREPYKWSSKIGANLYTDPSSDDVEKPKNLATMIELSEVIAKDFDYVRVDWYDVDGKLYFGEITFHHDGGTRPILPPEWDKKLGERLRLSPLPTSR